MGEGRKESAEEGIPDGWSLPGVVDNASPFVQLPQINPTANAPRPIDPACHTIWFYQGREEDKSLLEDPPNDDRFTYSGPINTSCR